jgi:hypothetical protein
MKPLLKMLSALSIIVLTLTLVSTTNQTFSSSLNLTVLPNKQIYNVGETVYISGNLTKDGLPVSDAIVAIEIDNPKGDPSVIRTLNTGPIDPTQWPLEILELIPCDSGGNPKYSFNLGGDVGFKIKAKNKAANPYDVIIMLSIIYSNKAPYTTFEFFRGSIDANKTKTITVWPACSIPKTAVTGNTTVYANIYNLLPKDNGFAYCPEKSASFLIGSSSLGQSTITSIGQFTLEIALSKIVVYLGNYTIHTTTRYTWPPLTAINTSKFEVILLGDLYPDGKIDMKDIAKVARSFGANNVTDPASPHYGQYWHSTPCAMCPHPPDCDINIDGKIDMKDLAIVARAYGTMALRGP